MQPNTTQTQARIDSRNQLVGPCGTYQISYNAQSDSFQIKGPRSLAVNQRLKAPSIRAYWETNQKVWLVVGAVEAELRQLLSEIPAILAEEAGAGNLQTSYTVENFNTGIGPLLGQHGQIEVRKVQQRVGTGNTHEPAIQLRFPRREAANSWLKERQFTWDGTGWSLGWKRVYIPALPKILSELNQLLQQPLVPTLAQEKPLIIPDLSVIQAGNQNELLTIEVVPTGLRITGNIEQDDWLLLKPYATYYREDQIKQYVIEESDFLIDQETDRAGWNYNSAVVDILAHRGYQIIYGDLRVRTQQELQQAIDILREQEAQAMRETLRELQNWQSQAQMDH